MVIKTGVLHVAESIRVEHFQLVDGNGWENCLCLPRYQWQKSILKIGTEVSGGKMPSKLKSCYRYHEPNSLNLNSYIVGIRSQICPYS
jgi:hypothetical protein